MDICSHWNDSNVTQNLQGRLIYKDECCRCFGSPKGKSGLDVCLSCFVGSCSESGVPAEQNHSSIHSKQKGHPIVLRILKTPKAVDAPVQVTKLAIGRPGGVDPEADRWETSVKVYCHTCDAFLDYTHP